MFSILLGQSPVHRRKEASENADYLHVIGAGLPRTGTSSLKAALEFLGFGPCHHMSELFDKPERCKIFARALDGKPTDFKELMKGYGSGIDAPVSLLYKEIYEAYPKAKIILTVRDNSEQWFNSYRNSIESVGTYLSYYIAVYPIRNARLQCMVARKLVQKWTTDYGEVGPRMYEKHNSKVIKDIEPENLLIFNVKEGWEPLCKFLNVPIPENVPFPNVNDTKYITERIKMIERLGWYIWAGLFGTGAVAIYLILSYF